MGLQCFGAASQGISFLHCYYEKGRSKPYEEKVPEVVLGTFFDSIGFSIAEE